ncbi:MAG: hypothetical protein ORO03_05995, partial [Alphaproteobacteria bacterium]|nr:hypothetical protein [Alphaproteobacteria bacterium]
MLARGSELRQSIEKEIGEIADPIGWQAKFREALGNHMRTNYGAGSVPVDVTVHKKGRGSYDISDTLPSKTTMVAMQQRLN